MPLQYFAGQRLTADALQLAVPERVVQGSDQDVTSSTTLVDSSIVVAVDDLIQIDLEARFTSGGGGIDWAWSDSGSITSHSRSMASAGLNATTGSTYNQINEMRFRSIFTLTEVTTHNHDSTSTAGRIHEVLVVEGSGTLTFQFAQNESDGSATTLDEQSYALITRLGS